MNRGNKLTTNVILLTVVQGANYLLPLITIPYLLRVLSPEYYGAIAFAQSIMMYFILISDYGFNLTATRLISINMNDKKKISNIVSSVFLIKIFISLICFIILLILIITISKIRDDYLLYLTSFGMVISNLLFPIWLFQGLQRMGFITFINLFSKIINILLIFTVVKTSEDYIFVPIANNIGAIILGALTTFFVLKKFSIELYFPTFKDLKKQVIDGWHIFLSQASVSLYTSSNILILGIFTNNEIVGYFSAAEKIIKSCRSLLTPVSQAFYPHISYLSNISPKKALVLLRNLLIFVGSLFFLISVAVYYNAEIIVNTIMSDSYKNSIIVLKIISFIPFIGAIGNICGQLTMVNFGLKKQYSKILIFSGLINIILSVLIVPVYKEIGTAICIFSTELLVTTLMIVILQRNKISLFL